MVEDVFSGMVFFGLGCVWGGFVVFCLGCFWVIIVMWGWLCLFIVFCFCFLFGMWIWMFVMDGVEVGVVFVLLSLGGFVGMVVGLGLVVVLVIIGGKFKVWWRFV